MKPVICPYCTTPAKLVSSKKVYQGRNFGPIYLCEPCSAWVGCHPNTTIPLGRLADATLRRLKSKAHKAFDPIWKQKIFSRKQAYAWLARSLKIPKNVCHIGVFDEDYCRKTIEVSNKFMKTEPKDIEL